MNEWAHLLGTYLHACVNGGGRLERGKVWESNFITNQVVGMELNYKRDNINAKNSELFSEAEWNQKSFGASLLALQFTNYELIFFLNVFEKLYFFHISE